MVRVHFSAPRVPRTTASRIRHQRMASNPSCKDSLVARARNAPCKAVLSGSTPVASSKCDDSSSGRAPVRGTGYTDSISVRHPNRRERTADEEGRGRRFESGCGPSGPYSSVR